MRIGEGVELYVLHNLALTLHLLHLVAGTVLMVWMVINHPLPPIRGLLVDQFGDGGVLVEECHGSSAGYAFRIRLSFADSPGGLCANGYQRLIWLAVP